MDISLFYQLWERLNASIIAGCSTINEDFRLKRAVEAFEPLSKANKVFAKLYNMCNELFTAENPAPLLADCVALCDALAVTQATFKDNSETHETKGFKNCIPCNIRHSQMQMNINFNTWLSNLVNFGSSSIIRDPRTINRFIEGLKNLHADYFENAQKYVYFLGKDSVPLLKEKLNLSDPKEKGTIVKLIGYISGADENEWYLSLAQNEEYPQSVREEAVKCLAYDINNKEILLELYKTGKTKIKDAAAEALIKLDVEDVDIIIKKIASGRFMNKHIDLIAASKSKAARDFAVEFAEKNMKEKYTECVKMLANKTGVEDILLKLARCYSGHDYSLVSYVARLVLLNLAENEEEEYRTMLENLYHADKKIFSLPYIFMALTEDRGISIESEEIKSIVSVFRYNFLYMMLHSLKYDNINKRFTLKPFFNPTYNQEIPVKEKAITAEQFENIMKLVTDTSYFPDMDKKGKCDYYSYTFYTSSLTEYIKLCAEFVIGTALSNEDIKEKTYIDYMCGFCKEYLKYQPNTHAFMYLCIHDSNYINENPDLIEYVIKGLIEKYHAISEYYFRYCPVEVLRKKLPEILEKLETGKYDTINAMQYKIYLEEIINKLC